MSKNVEQYKNKIYHGDCLEFMKQVPDNYFDLILTDPPYEIALTPRGGCFYNTMKKYRSNGMKDICNGFSDDILIEFIRITKKLNCFIFCSNKQITKICSFFESKNFTPTILVWHKYNAIPFVNNVWKSDIEFCIHVREAGAYFKGSASEKTKVTRLPLNPTRYGHPTEKPLKLIEKYLKLGATKGHKVFDPFMGSGTTAVACKSMGIDFFGCEIEEKYIDIANKRLKRVQKILF